VNDQKTMTRAEFEALDPAARRAVMKAGTMLTDGVGSPSTAPVAGGKPMMARAEFDALPAAERAAAARSHVLTDGPVAHPGEAEILVRAPGAIGFTKTTLAELLAAQSR